MDQNQSEESSLFGLTIDSTSRSHLGEAANWARFIAIAAFICITLFAIMLIVSGSYISSMMSSSRDTYRDRFSSENAGFTFMIIYYILVCGLAFLAYLFLYRFAINLKRALAQNSQELLNKSFQNLKVLYRYVGILTIIGLVFFLLALLTIAVGFGSRGV